MAGRARAVAVNPTKKRRRKLEQIVRASSSPQRLVLRARIVLLAADGMANAGSRRGLGCSVAVVRTWRRRFACRGIPGLFDKPRSGRPEVHGPSATAGGAGGRHLRPARGGIAVVTGDDRRATCGERGLVISAATVGRVLAEAEVRPHKVRGWLNRADDPAFWVRPGAVCRLYLNPPPGTVLISVDEKTGIQAKSRKHPHIPARPGRDARREFEYVRHGTVSIIAAMNVTTGQVIAERIERNDSGTFIAFLAMLHQMIPAAPAHPPDHGQRVVPHLPATRAWLAAHPRFAVTYTPKHASWLNMIEQWFGVADPPPAPPRRASPPATTSKPRSPRSPSATTSTARPYRWSYDADAEHARYLERHPQPEAATALPEAA